jgi:excisionase family DNA binding protein
VAREMRVSYWTARGYVESGKLTPVKLPGGRLLRIKRSEFDRFIAELA